MPASDNVVPFAARAGDAPAEISDWVYQRNLMRALSRHWRSELSDREYTMLAYIMDHTVEWGRLAYRFTYRSLAEGTAISPSGLNKGEQQLRETLVALERKGAVSVVRGRDGLAITFNPQWKPATVPRKRPADAETPLEIQGGDPRKPKGQTLGNPDLLEKEHLEDQTRRTTVASGSADAALRNISTSSDFREPQFAVPSQIRQRARPTRLTTNVDDVQRQFDLGDAARVPAASVSDEQKAVAAAGKLKSHREFKNPGSFWNTWEAAWNEVYGNAGASLTAWTKADMGALNKTVIAKWKGSAAELHEFVDWSVREWSMIRVTEFGWMKRDPAPMAPSIRFFLHFAPRFVAAFNKREVDRALSGLDTRERTRREMMIKQGASAEEADREIAKGQARVELRDEIEAGVEKGRQLVRQAAVANTNMEKRQREHMRRVQRALQRFVAPPPSPHRWLTEEEQAEAMKLVASLKAEPFE